MSLQSLLLVCTSPFSDESKGVDSFQYSSVVLHNVYLSSNLVSGPVVLGIKLSLPFEGNDLARDKVPGGPLLTNKPCCDQAPDLIEQKIPHAYSSCAVTQATSKKQTIENVVENHQLNDAYKYNLSKERFSNQGQPILKSSFTVEQNRDADILPPFEKAVDDNDISRNPVCYFIKKNAC